MAKEKAPAYQWYPKDFNTDERVSLMSWAEQGVYRYLLDCQWLQGSIPSSVKLLARMCRVSEAEMGDMWETIGPCFEIEDDRAVNSRMKQDRARYDEWCDKQTDNGRRGGRPPQNPSVFDNNPSVSQTKPKPKRNLTSSSASALDISGDISPPISPTSKTKPRPNPSVIFPERLDFSEFRGAWDEWIAYRAERRLSPWCSKTIEKQFLMLSEQPDPVAVITHSIRNGWQGLFPLKEIQSSERRNETMQQASARLDRELAAYERGSQAVIVGPGEAPIQSAAGGR